MNTLFIIGNGFDLAHNLKTSYTDFIKWAVKQKYGDKKNQTKLFNIPSAYRNGNFNLFLRSVLDNKIESSSPNYTSLILKDILKDLTLNNWCDIEEKYYSFLSSINKDKTNRYYQLIETLNKDFELIKTELETYLTEQKAIVNIKSYESLFSSLTSKTSLILNFNYTNTLQDLYSKEIEGEIIHIHGQLNNEDNPIIFGYAANDEESNLLLDKNNNEYLRNIKRFAYNRTSSETKLKEYLQKNQNIHIIILGHSIGISDKLVLKQTLNNENIESIRIFYYKDYNGYFNTQVNLQRIMRDNSKFSKLKNFQDSTRMPQHNDKDSQIEETIQSISKFEQNYKTQKSVYSVISPIEKS